MPRVLVAVALGDVCVWGGSFLEASALGGPFLGQTPGHPGLSSRHLAQVALLDLLRGRGQERGHAQTLTGGQNLAKRQRVSKLLVKPGT